MNIPQSHYRWYNPLLQALGEMSLSFTTYIACSVMETPNLRGYEASLDALPLLRHKTWLVNTNYKKKFPFV